DYSCPIYCGNEVVGEEQGRLAVNALTRKVEVWSEKLDVVYTLEAAHHKATPSFGQEEADELARKEVLRLHSREKEMVRDEGHVTMTERKRVAPRANDIHLDRKGIFYLPIWCIEGIYGVMIINAGTGKIVSEDFYRF
ncbi:MAG: hypothetical protein QW520_05245, partial [Methanomassiliicoccales archaeon]